MQSGASLDVEQGLVDNVLGRIKRRIPSKNAFQDVSSGDVLDEAAKVGNIVERTGTNESQVLLNGHFVTESFVGKQDKKLLVSVGHRKDGRQTR